MPTSVQMLIKFSSHVQVMTSLPATLPPARTTESQASSLCRSLCPGACPSLLSLDRRHYPPTSTCSHLIRTISFPRSTPPFSLHPKTTCHHLQKRPSPWTSTQTKWCPCSCLARTTCRPQQRMTEVDTAPRQPRDQN